MNAERVLERHFAASRTPFVSVNQTKRALLPRGATLEVSRGHPDAKPVALKSFDFVVYGPGTNLLLEVKGRRANLRSASGSTPSTAGRLECWVTLGDIESLRIWQHLFGDGFRSTIGFLYEIASDADPGFLSDLFEIGGRRFALMCIFSDDYQALMKTRSARWKTVDLPQTALRDIMRPIHVARGEPTKPSAELFRPPHWLDKFRAKQRGEPSPNSASAIPDPIVAADQVWAAATRASSVRAQGLYPVGKVR